MRYKSFYRLHSIGLWHFEQSSSLLVLTFISSILVVLLVSGTPQGLYSDPAWQMKALQQYLVGESPSFNHLVTPRANDLSLDKAEWIFWWPPGTQLLAYPLMANGISMGDALRIIAIVCLILGSLGWVKWFSLFSLPLWSKVLLAIALPWMRFHSNALFMYSAEILVYASAPWLMLATHSLTQDWTHKERSLVWIASTSVILGISLGLVYILKYSAVFISLGILSYMGIVVYGVCKNKNRFSCWHTVISFVLAIIFFAIPVVLFNVLNYIMGRAMNPVTVRIGLNLRWENFLFCLGNPALAITDADAVWRYLLLHPQYGILRSYPWLDSVCGSVSIWLGLIGLPGGVLLLWLILYPYAYDSLKRLALALFFTNLVAIFCVWSLSQGSASYESRYIAYASMAVLPIAIQGGKFLWSRARSKIVKIVLAVAAIFYVAIPLAYSGVSVIGKVIRTPKNYAVGPAHIYNHLLASVDLAGVRHKLMQDFVTDKDIWYLPEPISALDISDRAVVTHADFTDIDELRKVKFFSSLPLRVHVLLPPHFEENGKGEVIRSSFIQAGEWEKKEIKGSKYICWRTTLQVSCK